MARTLPLLLVGAGLGLGALVVLSRRDPAPLGASQPTPPLAPPSSPPTPPAPPSSSPTGGRDTFGRVVDMGIDITKDLTKVLLNNKGTSVQDPPPPPPPEPEPPTPADQDLLESKGVKRDDDGNDIVVD